MTGGSRPRISCAGTTPPWGWPRLAELDLDKALATDGEDDDGGDERAMQERPLECVASRRHIVVGGPVLTARGVSISRARSDACHLLDITLHLRSLPR